MKSRSMFAAVCGAACAVVVGGAALVVGSTAANAESNDPTAAAATYEGFTSAQTSVDALPAFLQKGPQALEVVATTSRALGESDGIQYWVAENQTNQVCLIALLPGRAEMASMTCHDPSDVWSHGIGLQNQDKTHADRAFFVPSGYAAQLPGYTTAGRQLLVGNAHSPSGKLTVSRSRTGVSTRSLNAANAYGGGTVTLTELPAANPADLG